jgi:hypothetical protein
MSTICPNCRHRELEGALFCSECGAKLIDHDGLSTAAIRGTDSSLRIPSGSQRSPASSATPASEAVASLHVVRTGQIIPLIGSNEFTIGRVSEGQTILPDIDLTPYEAYGQGVSRLHATFKINNETLTVRDLGSSNGTRVNNEKLSPHKDHALQHGDVVALGQFKVQALVRQDDSPPD